MGKREKKKDRTGNVFERTTKMPLWAAETRISIRSLASSGSIILPDPEQDAARMAALKRLRHKFVRLCSENNRSKPPVLAFERWLGRASLKRGISTSDGYDPIIPSDSVMDKGFAKDISRTLPSWAAANAVAEEMTKEATKQIRGMATQREEIDEHKNLGVLRKKIREEGRTIKQAVKTVNAALKLNEKDDADDDDDDDDNELDDGDRSTLRLALVSLQRATAALNESTTKAQQALGGANNSAVGGGGKVVLNGNRRDGIYDVMLCGPCGKPRRPYLTISSLHLSKLLRLWKLKNKEGNDDGNDDGNQIEVIEVENPIDNMNALLEDDRIMFTKSLYCCLARYEGLKGAGYQCAVPGVAFDAAIACGLGSTIECFASPLNCRYQKFCSAFPDIESRFGSLGSFFDDEAFNPLTGTFEANPPFVPEIMVAMGTKLKRLLGDKSRGALSFLVVVPAWGAGIDFVTDLESSTYVRASSRIKASDHAFCDGAQHTKPLSNQADPNLRPSSWDTAVILLQNDSGALKWDVDDKKLEESFCNALKATIGQVPDKFTKLDDWERRGVGQGGGSAGSKGYQGNPNKRPFAKEGNRNIDRKRFAR